MEEIENRFDVLVPTQDSAEKIGKYVRKLLVESKENKEKEAERGIYYGTALGRKYKYWSPPGSSELRIGPVDATDGRMVPITRGAYIEGNQMTYEQVVRALRVHDTATMIHNLIDGRQAFEAFVNAPSAEAEASAISASSPGSADIPLAA